MPIATIIALSDPGGGEEALGRVAAVFGAVDEVCDVGLPAIDDNHGPGTPRLPSLVAHSSGGPVLTF